MHRLIDTNCGYLNILGFNRPANFTGTISPTGYTNYFSKGDQTKRYNLTSKHFSKCNYHNSEMVYGLATRKKLAKKSNLVNFNFSTQNLQFVTREIIVEPKFGKVKKIATIVVSKATS